MIMYEPLSATTRSDHVSGSMITYEASPGDYEEPEITKRNLWRPGSSKCNTWLALVGVVLLVCSCVAGIVIYVFLKVSCKDCVEYAAQVSPSTLGVYNRWAVSTDAAPCSSAPRRIFAKNGTLADAAVATLLCMGVVLPHSMGIGGGFLATVYQRKTRRAWSLIAREKAPKAAHRTMFVGQGSASTEGAKAIGVPGELRGYQALLERMGSNLPWKDLFEEAIKFALEGLPVHSHLAAALKEKDKAVYGFANMRNLFWNNKYNATLKEGSLLFQKELGETLKAIAENGADYFYTGEFAKELAKEVQEQGGILTAGDLKEYKAEWVEPVTAKFRDGRTLYSAPPPGSGAVLAYLLQIMDAFRKSPHAFLDDDALTLHRFIEACKFAYGQRAHLGDPYFVDNTDLLKNMTSSWMAEQAKARTSDSQTFDDPAHYSGHERFAEDHGTAHASFWGPNGDAISVTSSVNYYFGSFVRTSSGVVLNDQMDDFSTPGISNVYGIAPSKSNFIEPGKRPMSSMAPAIFVNASGGVDLILGGAGGAKITSGIALVAMRNLWQGDTIKEAIDFPRIHHQLIPNNLDVERGFPEAYVKRFEARGHHVERPIGRFSIMMGISRYMDRIQANADYRKGGTVDGE